jgi:hypothetical protein
MQAFNRGRARLQIEAVSSDLVDQRRDRASSICLPADRLTVQIYAKFAGMFKTFWFTYLWLTNPSLKKSILYMHLLQSSN